MTTTTTTTPSTGLHLPTDARPIAMLATTQSTATTRMSSRVRYMRGRQPCR